MELVSKKMDLVYETIKTMETESFRLKLSANGYTEIMVKHGAVYDIQDLIKGKEFLVSELKGKKAYILLELEGDVYTSREARELAASDEHSAHHGAIAIHSEKLAPRLLGNLYIRINRPKAPTRFFGKRSEAIAWLKGFIEKGA